MTAHPLLATLAFVVVYAGATALSLPGALFLTMAGGFLFGTWLGGLLSVIGATSGAVVLFLIARSSLGAALRDRAGPWLMRLEAGFRRDAFSYLLVLRLVPLFPFWLVNLVPALLDVPLSTFALATFVGIIPGGLVYASVGSGLGAVLDRGEQPDLDLILEPQVFLPLLGLAALALAAGDLSPLAAALGRRGGLGLGRLAHAQELVAAAALELGRREAQERTQLALDRVAHCGDGRRPAAMCAAQRLLDHHVDQAVAEQVLGGQPQRLGGDRRLVGAAPQDGGTALGRDHRIDRVLEHQDAVGGGQRDGPAGAALADDGGDERHLEREADLDRARDRLGLAALLGIDARDGRPACRRRSGPAGESARPAASAGPPCGSPQAAPCRNCGAPGPRCRHPSHGR